MLQHICIYCKKTIMKVIDILNLNTYIIHLLVTYITFDIL